jgi:hypothetical protein
MVLLPFCFSVYTIRFVFAVQNYALSLIGSYNSNVDDPGEALKKARQFADTAYVAAVDAIAKDSREKLVEAREQLATRGLIQSSVMARKAAQIYGAEVKAIVQARLDGLLEGFELYNVPLDEALINRIVDELMGLVDTTIINTAKTSAATNNTTLPAGHFPELVRSECGISRASVKVQIERKRLMSKKKDQPSVTNVYHVHGNNPRWNTNSTDNSLNVVITSHQQVFADLRKQIESGVPAGDEQKDVLEKLTAMEQAHNSPTFGRRMSEFVSAAANYMTIIGPFIPALMEMLQRTL